ncbi:ATP-dependent helicase HrpB [Natronospira bacteriovora]|uniref:ATP-dependent helicase HrpB n=1 Tax=Natronospira bacteriovora TaxID=3069753 RepID=A0ABU0W3T2_9GAMM|nr:ATP-dependent helicase HrpB [Natronospira sp. AB-CW4]MDQ2068681.1 ATP-dependent helicase HrpB [Natronospira sp. AB-CW4]
MPDAPINSLLPELRETLRAGNTVILEAPPGAGKTTAVPPALLDADWLGGRRILLLEPRRLAARAAARYMASQMGEAAGQTVGYRTRLDSRVSAATRIEVVTEGILTRLLQADPELPAYGAILFDEFHERSLQADLGLALARETQQALRPDLRLLVMSATLDTSGIATLLRDAPVIRSEGRSFPVETRYAGSPARGDLLTYCARTIHQALTHESGSLLVFLPGVGEIRRLQGLLTGTLPKDVLLTPLYGQLPPEEQDRAIQPAADGVRKVVLSTAIAESSLTIDGIRVVVDAGLERAPRFDAASGMSRLQTRRVSKASADQRRGRAGRTQAGVCYRLWGESEQAGLAAHSPPEIREADLAPLVLELAQWGVSDPGELLWLDAPPAAHWQQALDLLQQLEAIEAEGRITAHGQAMLPLGLHPRLAHMILRARESGLGQLAAELAALLEERDLLDARAGSDVETRLQLLRGETREAGLSRKRLDAIRRQARKLQTGDGQGGEAHQAGRLLALAFPDRIARRRPGQRPRYQLSGGRGAWLAEDDPLSQQEWLVAASLDGEAREARIFLAATVSLPELEEALPHHFSEHEQVGWDDRRGTVTAQRERRLGAIVVASQPLAKPAPEHIQAGLVQAIRERGLAALPWSDMAIQYRARMGLLHKHEPEQWPAVDDASLEENLENWLGPYLAGMERWRDLDARLLLQALKGMLDHGRQTRLEALAPERLAVPSGHSPRLDYTAEQGPVLAVKLQALFGLKATPRILDGRLSVVCHLLSPAGRPLAVTSDLASFWQQAYPEVRKDMRGRYPKHPWPEDPLSATPSMRSKRRS